MRVGGRTKEEDKETDDEKFMWVKRSAFCYSIARADNICKCNESEVGENNRYC